MFAIIKETKTKREILGPFKTRRDAQDFLYSPAFKKYKWQVYFIRQLTSPNDFEWYRDKLF